MEIVDTAYLSDLELLTKSLRILFVYYLESSVLLVESEFRGRWKKIRDQSNSLNLLFTFSSIFCLAEWLIVFDYKKIGSG